MLHTVHQALPYTAVTNHLPAHTQSILLHFRNNMTWCIGVSALPVYLHIHIYAWSVLFKIAMVNHSQIQFTLKTMYTVLIYQFYIPFYLLYDSVELKKPYFTRMIRLHWVWDIHWLQIWNLKLCAILWWFFLQTHNCTATYINIIPLQLNIWL